jgi:hypothetical protein
MVGQNQVEGKSPHYAEGLAAIAGLKDVPNVEIGLPQRMLDDFPDGGRIVDN